MPSDAKWSHVEKYVSDSQGSVCDGMNDLPVDGKLYIAVSVALSIAVLLLVVQPPFIHTHEDVDENGTHVRVNSFSLRRLAVWVSISFGVVYLGDYIHGLRVTS